MATADPALLKILLKLDATISSLGGTVSPLNSSVVPLGAGEVFTGPAEDVSFYSSITTMVDTDVDSASTGFSMQFSMDGLSWDRAKSTTLDVSEANNQAHGLAVVSKYFRMVYTNGPIAQGHFRLQTIYHGAKPRDLTSGTTQSLGKWDDTQLVRVINDPCFDNALGRVGYQSVIIKSGFATGVGTSFKDVWNYASTLAIYPFPTTAETVRIKSGGDTADAAAGLGAQTVRVIGLDENWETAVEVITTAGSSASSATTTTFRRVNAVFVVNAGTYGGANTDEVVIENTSSNQILGVIPAGEGRTNHSHFTVPLGITAWLRYNTVEVSVGNTAEVRGFKRSNADDISTPFSSKSLIQKFVDFEGFLAITPESYASFTEKTDIWWDAKKVSGGGTASVSVRYDLTLVENDI